MLTPYGIANAFLHEDQFKMGVPVPPGIMPLRYFAWAAIGGGFAFNGSGTNVDGQLTSTADNTNGTNEGLVQKGSSKTWNPWRYGSSYWELEPESRWVSNSVAEFTLAQQILICAMALYVHGWDGNV